MTHFILLFLYIFGWKINSLIDIIFIISAILSFILIISRKSLSKLDFTIIVLLFLMVLYTSFVFIFNNPNETQFIFRTIRTMVNYIGGISLVVLYKQKYAFKFSRYILLHLYTALLLHGLLIVLMYLFPSLRIFIYDITSPYSIVNPNAPFLTGLRITGLTYGLASTSVLQMFGLLIYPSVLHYWCNNIFKTILSLVSLIIMVLSIVLAGNTGLLFGFLFFPFILLVNSKKFKITKKRIKLLFIGVLVFILLYNYIDLMPGHFFSYNMNKADEIIQFFNNRGSTQTTKTISDMYHLPNDLGTFIFGSSILGRGNPMMTPSDVGWIRIICAVGIVGTVIFIAPILLAIIIAFKIYKSDKLLSTITLMTLLSSVAFNFKEIGLYTRNAWSVQSILIATSIIILQERKQYKKK